MILEQESIMDTKNINTQNINTKNININHISSKQINRIVRPIITLIIAGVLLLMLPILSGVVAIPFFIFGQHIAYIVSRFIQNLYGPLIVIILIAILPTIFRIIFALRTNGIKTYKFSLKNAVITLVMLVFGVYMTFQSFQNIANLVLDIGVVATSEYAKTDGKLILYEATIGDDVQTFMEINGIQFSGGNVLAGDLVEGDYYQVEYLPHSKYVVKYESSDSSE